MPVDATIRAKSKCTGRLSALTKKIKTATAEMDAGSDNLILRTMIGEVED